MYQLQSALSFLGFLPELVILIMAGLYMTRSKRNDAKLLFTGSVIHLLTRIFYFIIPFLTVMKYDNGDRDYMQNVYFFAGVVTFIGSVIFCIGLVMLIQSTLRKLPQA
jgi:predicted permease